MDRPISKAAAIVLLLAAAASSGRLGAQTGGRFGLEDSVNTWSGTAGTETAAISSAAGTVRTGKFALVLTSSSTGTGSKQWYSNAPYATSANGTYIHLIYWARAAQAGTAADGSLRYSSTAPPAGSNSSANAGSGIAIPTTTWERVVNSVTTSSVRHYYPAPRKLLSTGAMSWYIDDGVMYTSSQSAVDTTAPLAPATLTATVSGSIASLAWTSNTDAGTGVQRTLILRTNVTSSGAPVLNAQAEYSTSGGAAGPNMTGNWTVISTSVGPTATSYIDGSASPGTYKYAVVLCDLAYNYSVAAVSPTITIGSPVPTLFIDSTGFATDFGTVVKGSSSAVDSFRLSGFNLGSAALVTPPAGFEVSLTRSAGFLPTVSVPAASGTIVPQYIFLRFSPTTALGKVGPSPVTVTATGATTRTVLVSGTSIETEPSTTGTLTFGNVGSKSAVINLPTTGNGTGRLIVLAKDHEVNWLPADGAAVSGVNADYELATELGGGERIVYSGTGSGDSVVVIRGLTPATLYYAAVYEYNVGQGASFNYLPVSDLTAFARTAFEGVSVPTAGAAAQLRMYPNPATSRVFVPSDVPVRLELADMSGRTMLRTNEGVADVEGLPSGIYTLKVLDTSGRTLQIFRLTKH